MSLHPQIQRAELLLQQERYAQAEVAIRDALIDIPEEALAYHLLTLALIEQNRLDEALQSARTALELEPHNSHSFYSLALVYNKNDDEKQALQALQDAIALNPFEPAYYALLSGIYLEQGKWSEGLSTARAGLNLDPEHITCTNLAAMALMKLGQKTEAQQLLDSNLANSPEVAFTHANQGWVDLEHGQAQKALEHFKESLRLNPDLEWARAGMLEALKSRHFIYRWILKYFLWMSKFNAGQQWMIILGGYFVFKVLSALGRAYPPIAPFTIILIAVYLIFILLTWIASPLFNLLLRLDPVGKHLLNAEQIRATNWISGALMIAAFNFGALYIFNQVGFLLAALGFISLMIPISGSFNCPEGKGRQFLGAYTLFLTLCLFMANITTIVAPQSPVMILSIGTYFLGFILFSWIANFILLRR